MAFMFEKLKVYQKAVDFADRAASLTERFPRGYRYLADQLNRASLSVAANIAEGNGRFTKPDRRNFFRIARGSAQECVPLLELAGRGASVPAAARPSRSAAKGVIEEASCAQTDFCHGLLARRRALVEDGVHEQLKSNLEEVARMLSGLIRGMDKRKE